MIVWLNGAPGADRSTAARELLALLPQSTLYDPEPFTAPLRASLPDGPVGTRVEDHLSWRRLLVDAAAALLTEVPGPLLTAQPLLRQDHRDEIFGGLAARRIPVHHVWLDTAETIRHGDPDPVPRAGWEVAAHRLAGVPARSGAAASAAPVSAYGTLTQRPLPAVAGPPAWVREDAHVLATAGLTPRQVAEQVAQIVLGGADTCEIVQTPEPRSQTLAAGILLFDDRDRVLLVDPTYKPGWEFPGGVVEEGEAPLRAGLREVAEELGLSLSGAPRLLVVDWEVPAPPGLGGLRFLFDGGRLAQEQIAAVLLPEDELRQWRFVTEDEAADLLPPVRFNRLYWALRARERGCPLHLEDGAPVG
ncbi:NUDIX domain-containing protein [Streptomyces sp. NPDC059740]|uniref:NUDIX domain-containing protein n=1 Tax=Streptomyces sp. NPDC059740 TaxID=3346926 RepID=UPI003667BF9E